MMPSRASLHLSGDAQLTSEVASESALKLWRLVGTARVVRPSRQPALTSSHPSRCSVEKHRDEDRPGPGDRGQAGRPAETSVRSWFANCGLHKPSGTSARARTPRSFGRSSRVYEAGLIERENR